MGRSKFQPALLSAFRGLPKTMSELGLGTAIVAIRTPFPRVLKEALNGKRYSQMVNAQRNFGSNQPFDGGKDVSVDISAVERAGLSSSPRARRSV